MDFQTLPGISGWVKKTAPAGAEWSWKEKGLDPNGPASFLIG
jgi:hypothetical protein